MKWTNMPPLSALRAFAAYAETNSVQRAGDALNVSHAAVSQQIRRLEEYLGVGLVDRSGRQMSLTAAGQDLAYALADGFGAIARGVEAVSSRGADRPLQVTTTASFASFWLMPRLPRFRAAHPEISLMIDPSAKTQDLSASDIDIALRYGEGDWPGVVSELVHASSVAIVAAPELVGEDDIASPDALRCYPWLQELGTNEATDWLDRNGVGKDPASSMLSLPGNLVLEAARQAQGVAITSAIAVQDDVASGRLRMLFEEDQEKGYFLVTRPGVQRPAVRHFIRWIRREIATDPVLTFAAESG